MAFTTKPTVPDGIQRIAHGVAQARGARAEVAIRADTTDHRREALCMGAVIREAVCEVARKILN